MYPLHLNNTTTPAHTAKLAQKWIATNCSDFIGKDEWPPNSHQTLILLITMSGELCLNATRRFNPTIYHRRAEESLANNMGWSATELHQQGHTELCKKTSSLCESLGRTFWTRLEINFLQGFELLESCESVKCQISMFSFDINTSTMMKIVIYIVIVLHGSVVV